MNSLFKLNGPLSMQPPILSQLDSMIAAVKTESSALDQMKEKLKEVDNLRNQIAIYTKKLLEADQANLNMKTNILKLQEQQVVLKKAKSEAESTMVPVRTELNKLKELCGKERMTRLSAQQEATVLKDHVQRLESMNMDLSNENKMIPALQVLLNYQTYVILNGVSNRLCIRQL
jgi:chromosome segregation ATPase